MARINIEDSLFSDFRFNELTIKLGGIDTALGAIVRAWRLAQKHFLTTDNDRLIPLNEWERQRIPDEIIEVGLAERRKTGIYLCGAEKQFSWLLQRQNAGKAKKTKKKKRKKTTVNETKRPKSTENDRQRVETSLLSSLYSNSNSKESPSENGPASPPVNGVNAFFAIYVSEYQKAFGATPPRGGPETGILKRFAREMRPEQFSALWQTYLQMEDPWFTKKGHDLATFNANLTKVSRAAQKGHDENNYMHKLQQLQPGGKARELE